VPGGLSGLSKRGVFGAGTACVPQAAILNHTALKLAKIDSAEYVQTLLQQSQQIGGMLELARRLNDHRLVRFVEAHKDALTRMIEVN
jgi:hypothetical protein